MDFEFSDIELDNGINPKNREFLIKLKVYNSTALYEILKKISRTVSVVVNKEDDPSRELIMKTISLRTSSVHAINATISSFRSVFNLIGDPHIKALILGDSNDVPILDMKCKYPERFSCYKDFFIVRTERDTSVVSIYEKVAGIDLFEYLDLYMKKKEFIDVPTLINIAYSLLTSLWIMHYHGIYHRDIKPENIIYDSSKEWAERLKYIDFDFSCSSKINSCQGRPGTPLYVSRYIAKSGSLEIPNEIWDRADIVSLAITLFRLYTFNFEIFIQDYLPLDNQRELLGWINDRTKRTLDPDGATFAIFVANMFDFDTNPEKRKIPLSNIIKKFEEMFKKFIKPELIEQFKIDISKL